MKESMEEMEREKALVHALRIVMSNVSYDKERTARGNFYKKWGFTVTDILKDEKPEIKERKCLAAECGILFMSAWAGNRICPSCSIRIKNIEGLEEYSIQTGRGGGSND